MSFIYSERCRKLKMSMAQKGVLNALADAANDNGVCWPSIRSIMIRTCTQSDRTVTAAIAWLEEHGALVKHERVGRANLYRLTPENYDGPRYEDEDVSADVPPQELRPRRKCSPAADAPPQEMRESPAADAGTPPQEMRDTPAANAPITIKNHKEEPPENSKGGAGAPSAPKSPAKAKTSKQSGTVSADQLVDEGVERQVAEDWLKVRRVKDLPLTPTAWEAVKTEAEAAGLLINEAVKISAQNSWAGFKSTWYAKMKAEEGSAAGARDDLEFLKSWPGILAKGNALGLKQEPGELAPHFKLRVVKAANLSPEQIARARADFQVNI